MTTIEEILSENRIDFRVHGQHHHCSEGWIQIDCPNCSPRSGCFRLGINLSGRYCSCWVCGGLSLAQVLSLSTDMKYGDCVGLLKELPSVSVSRKTHTGTLAIPSGMDSPGALQYAHESYLIDRRLKPKEIVRVWGVRGIGQLGGRLRWRLFIPIHLNGEVVSWTTRSLKNTGIRYLNASREQSSVPPDDLIYGLDHVRSAAVIVEGPIDVWAIGPGAVAMLGQRINAAKMDLLSRIPKRVICFDAEPAAQKRARKLAADLSVFPGRTIVVELETGKDPASSSRSEIESLQEMLT